MKNSLVEQIIGRRVLKYWDKAAHSAESMSMATLKDERAKARILRSKLNQVIHIGDKRLQLPYEGSNAMLHPRNSDWSHRPEVWRGSIQPTGIAAAENKAALGHEVTIFHDCKTSELTLRQVRNSRERDLAPYGLRMDVFEFDGSFLSLVLDLPQEAVSGLLKSHLLRMDVIVETERPTEIFARLNIKQGPNTEQVVRELPLHEEDVMVEFDLAYTKMNENRVERLWIDLIFENPKMNQITIRDLTLSRQQRAEL